MFCRRHFYAIQAGFSADGLAVVNENPHSFDLPIFDTHYQLYEQESLEFDQLFPSISFCLFKSVDEDGHKFMLVFLCPQHKKKYCFKYRFHSAYCVAHTDLLEKPCCETVPFEDIKQTFLSIIEQMNENRLHLLFDSRSEQRGW